MSVMDELGKPSEQEVPLSKEDLVLVRKVLNLEKEKGSEGLGFGSKSDKGDSQ